MKRNIFLSLLIFIIIVILNCILGITSAQEKSIIIRINNREYQVQEDGIVVKYDRTVVQDTSIIEKAHYTAMVTRERITESRYNQVAFAPVTKTMIDLQSLVKPLAGGYAYVLLSSIDITSSLLEGVAKGGPTGAFGNVAKEVTKDLILEVTKELVEHPEKTAMKMADDAYALGLQAYRENYATYRSVTKEGYILSYDDAVNFMANEQQKELLGVAVQLIRDINSKKYQVGQYSEDSHKNQEIKQKILKLIADMKSESLGTKVDIAIFMTEFKPIFEEALSGLENYKPYADFEERVSSLNNAFSKTEYAYYQYKEPSELDTLDVAETNWDNSTILSPSEGSVKPKKITWERTFGGSGDDIAYSIIQTSDGGYAVAGSTSTKVFGNTDAWIIKLDSQGNILWDKTYGGSGDDWVVSLIQTSDSSFALVGGNESQGNGKSDAWIIKLDNKGNKVWDRAFGGSDWDSAYSLIQTTDGGYAVTGGTYSDGVGDNGAWIIKLDNEGNILWDKTLYRKNKIHRLYSIIQTTGANYIVSGRISPKEVEPKYYHLTDTDAWIIKLDNEGNILWDKTYGGSGNDWVVTIIQASEGEGYEIAGATLLKDAGRCDIWVKKLDNKGNMVIEKAFGGSGHDWPESIILTNDGGYVIAGYTKSEETAEDFRVIKLDNQGNVIWDRTYGKEAVKEVSVEEAYSIIQTNDNGYAVAGRTWNKGTDIFDAWVLKMDESGNIVKGLKKETLQNTYALRDTGPAGGYIFYDKGNYSDGWRYLEAAPESTEWIEKEWGSYKTKIGGTETGIGTGQSNTTKIVTWLNNYSETGKAAQLCNDLTIGGYCDWFLPSDDELNLMYKNLKVYGVGGFSDDLYWSSSEFNASIAWLRNFYYHGQSRDGAKYYPHRVRAVRVF